MNLSLGHSLSQLACIPPGCGTQSYCLRANGVLEMSCLPDMLLCSLTSNRRASAAEFAVFHIMTRILEATNSLFLPLPPGKSWLFCFLL